ncbi:hypothetical protein [Nesterenkonia haasae]|nr:hypothetical protein [Nesterenkonia haasae]
MSWAFAHGLVALVRDGALQNAGGGADAATLADELVSVFENTMN